MARMAFVQNIAFEYLGVMYISALLKSRGHVVEMFIVGADEGRTLAELAAFRPDLVGFSCTTGMHSWSLSFAAKVKEKIPARVIFGGAHPTYFPEIIDEPQVDIVCRSEGEQAVLELVEKIDRGLALDDTLNCWFKVEGAIVRNEQRPLLENLDELPFPDRDLYIGKYPYLQRGQYSFLGGRGCPFACTFCFNHALLKLYRGKGKLFRCRSVDNLLAEIKEVAGRYKLKTVYMQDDTFIINKKWVAEFAHRYKNEVGLPFVCLIRADLADEEVIEQLAAAGCRNVFFGVETGSEELRNTLLKKKVTDAEIREVAQLLKKHGIKFRTYNMLGLPGESLADAFRTVELNAEIGTDYPWCSLFHPFPGTELAEYAQEHGFLEATVETAQPSFFKESIVKSPHKRELLNLQKLFFYGVKFPWIMPVLKRLIRLRPNIFFDLAFLAAYGWCYWRSENLSLIEMLSVGMRNVRGFFFAKAR